ncbi:MAG: hypothetical protein ABJF23_21165 [Bryobacteraceae bacterium]
MARSELDKLVAATAGKGAADNGRSSFTRLMAEVLKLSRTPQKATVTAPAPPALPKSRTVQPEVTTAAKLLKAAPVAPTVEKVLLSGNTDLGRLAAQVTQLRRSITPEVAPVAVRTRSSAASNSAGSTGSSGIVKIISQVLGGSGLGSIVSGIAGLFAGGPPDAPDPLYRFSLPQAVSVEAGVTRSGQFVPVNYSQGGQARPNEAPQAPPQPMTVDTRWFLDHSEDIASAVKEAMLHSHSINDVVVDL